LITHPDRKPSRTRSALCRVPCREHPRHQRCPDRTRNNQAVGISGRLRHPRAGTRDDVQALHDDLATVLEPLGLRLSAAKTRIVHMSEGLDFLGFHIHWRRKRGTSKWYVYTFIADRPVRAVKQKVRDPYPQDIAAVTQGRRDPAQPDHARLGQLLPARSLQTHPGLPGKLGVAQGNPLVDVAAPLELVGRSSPVHRPPGSVAQTDGGRDRAVQHRIGRGHPLPIPRQQNPQPLDHSQPRLTADTVESPLPGDRHGGFGERPGETDREQTQHRAPGRLNQTSMTFATSCGSHENLNVSECHGATPYAFQARATVLGSICNRAASSRPARPLRS
jgi:hypothetical protein